MGAISFRSATSADAGVIAQLHVDSWREAYAGLFPAALLDGLSVEARSTMWRKVLDDPTAAGGAAVFVAESGGTVVGFGACGRQRDEALRDRGYDGEIGAIYVLRAHQRFGIGEALMRLMAAHLLDRGRSGAALWVLRDNIPARRFYEQLGGSIAGERRLEELGATVEEVAYGWSDLSSLIR